MAKWLVKTEPSECGIDDFARQPEGVIPWDGVRNYQARNRLRDEIQEGDRVLIYHSSCAKPAIVGEAIVTRAAYPDPTQFLPEHPAYDARSSREAPRWYQVDVRFVKHYSNPVTLSQLKQDAEFADMELVVRPRLSVQKVTERQYTLILSLCQPMDVSA